VLTHMERQSASQKTIFVNRFFYPDHSATSQILTDLALDLASSGVSVEVITSRLRYDDPQAVLAPTDDVGGVRVHRIWTSRFGRAGLLGRAVDYLTFYASAAAKLGLLAGRSTTVVIKTDPPMLALAAAPVAWLRGARWVNWLQDLFPEVAGALGVRLFSGPLMGLLLRLRNLTLRFAQANVVLGERMAERLHGQPGGGQWAVTVIPNWADAQAIKPVPHEANRLRKAWGLESLFVVGYSGNLGRAHEFNTFLAAAKLLHERADVAFLFIGGGAQRASVAKAADELGLRNVRFQPYQPRNMLAYSLGVADVHLVSLNPALEGLIVPSKFYGIAAAGRPTLFVGDTAGEVPRVLEQAQCGYAFASGDAQGLALAIAQLAGDPQRCQALGRNARELLEQRYDRRHALAAWRQLLMSGRPE
jgi:colanic acid biosynthesis glycosyl transferase WcaI